MREQILAAFRRGDEAEALRVVEPLNGTGCHVHYFLCLDAATIPGATKPGVTIKEVKGTATRNVFGTENVFEDDCDVCNFAARYLARRIISPLPGRLSSTPRLQNVHYKRPLQLAADR